jgi:hypothetical protein
VVTVAAARSQPAEVTACRRALETAAATTARATCCTGHRSPSAPTACTELAAEWREFAAFIDAAELDALPHKRLRALAKRAKVGASGSSDALRVRLHSFAQPTATPPAWFAIEPQARLEKLAAKQALRVALPSADHPTGTMTVNQHLDCGHDLRFKMGGHSSQVDNVSPPDRVQVKTWRGNKRITRYTAVCAGEFEVVLTRFRGAPYSLQEYRRVQMAIL